MPWSVKYYCLLSLLFYTCRCGAVTRIMWLDVTVHWRIIPHSLSPPHLNSSLTRADAYRDEWEVIWGSKTRRRWKSKSPSAGSLLFSLFGALYPDLPFIKKKKGSSWLIVLKLNSFSTNQMFQSNLHKSKLLITVSGGADLWMLARRPSVSSHNVDTRSS